MYHINYRSVSLSLLVSVAVASGLSAPVRGVEGDGILRLARVLPDEPMFLCVATSEFTIAGLKLYGDMTALESLGSLNSISRGFGEDDGGGYVLSTYHYGGLEVDIVRDSIDRIEARSPHWPTPSGLKAGMERADAMALLGREPDPEYLHDGVYSFSGCPEWRGGELVWHDSWYLEFAFNEEGRLEFVRLFADRP